MKILCYLLLFISLASCKEKKRVVRYKLSNNTAYAWGNLFDGGKITITDLSYTGFKFRLQVYDRNYSDSFSFPVMEAQFSGANEATTDESSNSDDPQFTIRILNDSSITIEQLHGDYYVLPWRKDEHGFIKNHQLKDNTPSLSFLDARMNYKIKRKTNGATKYLAECLQNYKSKNMHIDGIEFTCYSGAKPVGTDTFIALILTRDSFFTGAVVGGRNARGFSNDPYLGRPGKLDSIFSSWFHEKTNSSIGYYYYNANVDSL